MCSRGAVVRMPWIVSHQSRSAAMEPPCASTWRRWSLKVAAMSSPKSPRKSAGNRRSRRRKIRSARDMLEQRLSARDRQRVLEARRLGARHIAAERGQLVRSPPLVVFRGECQLANQTIAQQALDDAVERAGAQPDAAAG